MRIGVIGAGISGLAAAWLLHEEHEVVLFERDGRLGGHAHTVPVSHQGRKLPVDTAFQHFSAAMYPVFSRLLEVLGVETVASPVTSTLHWRDTGRSLLITPSARPRDLWSTSIPWLLKLHGAIRAGARVGEWETTVDAFLDGLRPDPVFRRDFLLPFLTAVLGTSLEDSGRMSARAALKYPVHHQPSHLLRPFEFREIAGGVVSYVRALAASLGTAEVRTGTAIERLERRDGRLAVIEAGGWEFVFDRLVLAAPARDAARLLAELPGAERLRAILGRTESIETAIAVHSDPGFMPPDRRLWAGYNILVDRQASEGTIWNGRRAGMAVFKSWVTHRGEQPAECHAALTYRHPLMTPDYFRIQEEAAALQGEGGVWLAGSYLQDIDSHESGVRSAVEVAKRLSPASKNLARLLEGAGGAA